MKKKTVPKLKGEAWQVFSRYIRLRDCLATTGSPKWGECVSCDETFEINKLQAGHFIPGRHNANLFSERGVHAQCAKCNRWHGGEPLKYRRKIIELYGEGADEELEAEARQMRKFTVSDLEKLVKYYEEQIKELLVVNS